MTLAAGSLNLDTILYIAAAVWGVISWWRNKNGENVERQAEEETPPQPEVRRTAAPQPAESEAERMRRFLEALGVPGGQQRPAPQPPVQRPPAQKPVARPVPPIPVPRPRPIARPKPAPIPEPEEMALAGRLEESASSIEGIGAEFDRMSGGVVLPAMAELATRADVTAFAEVSGATQVIPTAVTAKSIHLALRSPDILRTAFVLREVLGPPRSEAL